MVFDLNGWLVGSAQLVLPWFHLFLGRLNILLRWHLCSIYGREHGQATQFSPIDNMFVSGGTIPDQLEPNLIGHGHRIVEQTRCWCHYHYQMAVAALDLAKWAG